MKFLVGFTLEASNKHKNHLIYWESESFELLNSILRNDNRRVLILLDNEDNDGNKDKEVK